MRRHNVRSAVLVLAGVGLGTGLGGAVGSHVAWAKDHEHNPRIHAALDSLREAKAELADAKSDFHGHKHDAQEAVQHAVDELDRIKDW